MKLWGLEEGMIKKAVSTFTAPLVRHWCSRVPCLLRLGCCCVTLSESDTSTVLKSNDVLRSRDPDRGCNIDLCPAYCPRAFSSGVCSVLQESLAMSHLLLVLQRLARLSLLASILLAAQPAAGGMPKLSHKTPTHRSWGLRATRAPELVQYRVTCVPP